MTTSRPSERPAESVKCDAVSPVAVAPASVSSAAAPTTATSPASLPAPVKPVNSVDLAFVFRGEVDLCENVDPTLKVAKLRDLIIEVLDSNFGVKTTKYKLLFETLRKPDGTWPSEEEAAKISGRYAKFTNRISTEFKGISDEGEVHFRVKIRGEDEAAAEQPPDRAAQGRPYLRYNSVDEEEAALAANDVDLDDMAATFNSGCGYKHLSGRKRSSPSTFVQSNMAFSDMTQENTRRIFRKDEIVSFVQPSMKLPPELEKKIRDSYADLVLSRGKPWGQSEAQKRAFIALILDSCVATINKSNSSRKRLLLQAEFPIQCEELQASGTADWVISRGNRMLVVIEAKKSDIEKGQHQLMAMMEALRFNNKKTETSWVKIQAICTDFQQWLFVEREPGYVRQEFTGAGYSGESFPELIIPICERVLYVLSNL